MTCHRMQGQQVSPGTKFVVHIIDILQPGMAYVMLSRSVDYDDIVLEGKFPNQKYTQTEILKHQYSSQLSPKL